MTVTLYLFHDYPMPIILKNIADNMLFHESNHKIKVRLKSLCQFFFYIFNILSKILTT